MEKEIKEIPFGAKDSELYKFEYTIPEGYDARIEDGKVIVQKKESEDEKIRKVLLRCCDDWEKGQFGCMAKEDVPAIRAYLEKQKEQKPVISDEAIRDGVVHFGITSYQIDNWLKKHINVVGQKPAEWSEKDKECRDELIQYIEQRIGDDTTGQSLWEKWHSWIKSLPERFNLQSKQEWSDKDEDMLKSIIASCQLAAQDRDSGPAWKLCEMQERFLKSLHPQPHWKPSKKQIDALNSIILTGSFTYVGQTQDLISLKDELKKL